MKLSLDDFFTGLFAGLALRRRFVFAQACDHALVKAFEALPEELEPRFRLKLHPIHNDSTGAFKGLYGALQRGLGVFDGPSIRVTLTKEEAEELLKTVPGGRDVFLKIAGTFSRSV